jgi:hypothetical protein
MNARAQTGEPDQEQIIESDANHTVTPNDPSSSLVFRRESLKTGPLLLVLRTVASKSASKTSSKTRD